MSQSQVDDGQLRELLNVLSHDVRNPLAAIVTNLEAPFALPARLHLYEEYLKSVAGPAPLPPRPADTGKGFAE